MTKIPNDILEELLIAMDTYKIIAQELIDKLIAETNQPEKDEIEKGQYYAIQNADLLNGGKHLSGNWQFDVHGEHCLFKNLTTGQILEVSLGSEEDIGNLDPYFFYNFLGTTSELKKMTEWFVNPFSDMFDFFEELEQQKIFARISKVEFRKLKK